ncbi:hypothetical protein WJX74_004735 [Apatococcus lobatus]|uniref:Uncharacterized protein n=1 Tax=Apatococcus lobatus TaxID=904363 RepID=A0AAW1QCT6_9CHLO
MAEGSKRTFSRVVCDCNRSIGKNNISKHRKSCQDFIEAETRRSENQDVDGRPEPEAEPSSYQLERPPFRAFRERLPSSPIAPTRAALPETTVIVKQQKQGKDPQVPSQRIPLEVTADGHTYNLGLLQAACLQRFINEYDISKIFCTVQGNLIQISNDFELTNEIRATKAHKMAELVISKRPAITTEPYAPRKAKKQVNAKHATKATNGAVIGRNGPPPLGVGRARATHPSAEIAGPSTPDDTGHDDNLRETIMDSAFWDLDPRAEELGNTASEILESSPEMRLHLPELRDWARAVVFHSHVDLKLAPTDVETAINKSKQTQVRQRMNRLVDTRAQDGPKRRKISTAPSPAAQTSQPASIQSGAVLTAPFPADDAHKFAHPNTVKYTTPGPMGPVMKISEEMKPDDGSIWALVYCPGYGRFFAPDDTLVRMLPTKQAPRPALTNLCQAAYNGRPLRSPVVAAGRENMQPSTRSVVKDEPVSPTPASSLISISD